MTPSGYHKYKNLGAFRFREPLPWQILSYIEERGDSGDEVSTKEVVRNNLILLFRILLFYQSAASFDTFYDTVGEDLSSWPADIVNETQNIFVEGRRLFREHYTDQFNNQNCPTLILLCSLVGEWARVRSTVGPPTEEKANYWQYRRELWRSVYRTDRNSLLARQLPKALFGAVPRPACPPPAGVAVKQEERALALARDVLPRTLSPVVPAQANWRSVDGNDGRDDTVTATRQRQVHQDLPVSELQRTAHLRFNSPSHLLPSLRSEQQASSIPRAYRTRDGTDADLTKQSYNRGRSLSPGRKRSFESMPHRHSRRDITATRSSQEDLGKSTATPEIPILKEVIQNLQAKPGLAINTDNGGGGGASSVDKPVYKARRTSTGTGQRSAARHAAPTATATAAKLKYEATGANAVGITAAVAVALPASQAPPSPMTPSTSSSNWTALADQPAKSSTTNLPADSVITQASKDDPMVEGNGGGYDIRRGGRVTDDGVSEEEGVFVPFIPVIPEQLPTPDTPNQRERPGSSGSFNAPATPVRTSIGENGKRSNSVDGSQNDSAERPLKRVFFNLPTVNQQILVSHSETDALTRSPPPSLMPPPPFPLPPPTLPQAPALPVGQSPILTLSSTVSPVHFQSHQAAPTTAPTTAMTTTATTDQPQGSNGSGSGSGSDTKHVANGSRAPVSHPHTSISREGEKQMRNNPSNGSQVDKSLTQATTPTANTTTPTTTTTPISSTSAERRAVKISTASVERRNVKTLAVLASIKAQVSEQLHHLKPLMQPETADSSLWCHLEMIKAQLNALGFAAHVTSEQIMTRREHGEGKPSPG